jgi:hypothetical protein
MPLPGNLTAITLTGTYLTATGVPCSGTVTFNLDSVIADATGSVILYPSATVATLDANGSFSIELAATNDTHLYPEPFTYRVTERLTGAQPRVYSISLPSSLAPTVDLSTLTPTQPITPVGVTISGTPTTGQVPTATGPTTADWQTPSGGGSGDLLAANNLSDLASASAARANLGLGGAAVLGVGTSSGTVAAGNDTRIVGAAQAANNLSDLASESTARTNLGLGTAATQSSSAFDAAGTAATAQANAETFTTSAITALDLGGASQLNVGTGAGTVAAGNDSRIVGALQSSNNLSDVVSASTARTNLGLGGAATENVGTGAGTVAAGNDTRITGALQSANNLSDLGSASTARTNLGLGAAATAGAATSGAEGIIQLAGDIGGGTASAPQVTGTHLAAALPVAQGGTGQASASAAYNALAPTTTLGDLAYANGAGTNTRLPGTTSATKQYLQQTGNGSTSAAPAWGTIAAGDVPTLNQNTTGTAANITGTAAVANGGTGQTSAGAAFNALSPITALGDLVYGSAANTASRLAGSTSASKQFLVQTGTGSASAAPVWGGIAAGDLPAATTSAVGGVQFDGTSTDIAFLGVQAAGATGKAADAGHVHPAYEWMPSDQGLIAWNYDPSGAGTTWVPTSTTNGYLFLTAMILRQSATLTNIVYGLSGAQTSGLTSGENLIGLYNSSGTLLTQTADQTTIWSTTADQKVNTVPWATQQTNLAAGRYYIAFLYNGVATGAALNFKASGAGTTANAGQTGANLRYGVITGTATSLPGSITLSSMATPSPFNSQWLGFS